MKIMFICTGNICRSAMAHWLMDKKLKDNKIDNVQISDEAETSFRITAIATDETSKIAKYEYYINGTKHGENTTG